MISNFRHLPGMAGDMVLRAPGAGIKGAKLGHWQWSEFQELRQTPRSLGHVRYCRLLTGCAALTGDFRLRFGAHGMHIALADTRILYLARTMCVCFSVWHRTHISLYKVARDDVSFSLTSPSCDTCCQPATCRSNRGDVRYIAQTCLPSDLQDGALSSRLVHHRLLAKRDRIALITRMLSLEDGKGTVIKSSPVRCAKDGSCVFFWGGPASSEEAGKTSKNAWELSSARLAKAFQELRGTLSLKSSGSNGPWQLEPYSQHLSALTPLTSTWSLRL